MRISLSALAAAMLLLASCATTNNQAMNKDFLTLATERYSVRKFSDRPVEQEKLDKILEAGKVAPTAVNSQPQKIYVAKTPEAIEALNTVSPCLYGAPQCFVFCYNDQTVCKRGENSTYGEIDVTIVLTHMMLQAQELGIGSCIVGYFDQQKIKEVLNIPEGIHPILIMPFGYAAQDAKPSPRHSEYRPLSETVEYL